MTDIHWFKLTTDMFDDEKIKLIESMPDRDAILVIWIKLIGLAAKLNSNGWLYLTEEVPYDENMLATVLNRPANTVKLALGLFVKYGMIEAGADEKLLIVNFEKHQNIEGMDKIREQNRIRTARYRDNLRLNEGRNVTSRYSDAPDKIREDKIREEQKGEENTSGLIINELISGQTIETAKRIAKGEVKAMPLAKKKFQDELDKRGIPWSVK